ncbi:TetR/AcrR family transcriptional regulator [Sphingobium sp. EM0848]|uniref:TetR/AcrR family transcriptional regulator n=1 Tax=Sphingobium sp. EM0848 TaxID=2743473 RepID=UPI00159C8DC9|nr:TetR/AcrR family transcriptional regulator [Sphingobium sp. EM0848]
MQQRKAERLTQAERRAISEQSLLNAVTEILIEEGFTAATFDRISERSGYSRGMVRERFGSKEAFVEAAIRSTSEELASHYDELTESGRTPFGAIRAKIDTALWAIKNPNMQAYFVLLCASVANRLPQTDNFKEYHRRENRIYTELISKAQMDGYIPSDINSKNLASLIGCLAIGIAVQAQIDPEMNLDALQEALDSVFVLLGER